MIYSETGLDPSSGVEWINHVRGTTCANQLHNAKSAPSGKAFRCTDWPSAHTVAIIRFKHEKNLVLKGKQNVKYKSNCNKPFIVEIQFSTKAERKFKI